MSRSHTRESWDAHDGAGRNFRPLDDAEKAVLHRCRGVRRATAVAAGRPVQFVPVG